MARMVRITLIVFTILALTLLSGDSSLADYLASQFYVAGVVQQFNSFSEHGGQPLAISLWQGEGANPEFIGDDATSGAHYQGLARVDGPGGNPYLVLMRNGNPIAAGTDYPGEILITILGSKFGIAEPLGTNCVSTSGGKCEPSAGDLSYKSIHLNGYNDSFTGWKHVGSGQMIAGNHLLVPLEKICDYNSATEACNNNDENADQLVGGIQILDLSYPGSGHIEAEITTYLDTNGVSHKFPTIGVLAAIKDLNSEHYLLLITSGSFNHGRTVWFMDFDPATLTVTLIDEWYHTELADPSKWCNNCTFPPLRTNSLEWQMINFVRDRTTDDLYIITAANSTTALTDGADWARLFKVTPKSDFGPEDDFTITYEAEKHFYLNDPIKMGDFDAAEGVYVTPAGRLLLYTSPHDNDGWSDDDCSDPTGAGRCHAVQMGEFTATYYNPPSFTIPPADQTATEGTGKNFVLGQILSPFATTYTGEVDWGDGSARTAFSMSASGAIPDKPHTYADGPATVQATVTMTNADGFMVSDTFNVTVSNVAPTLSSFTRSGVDNDEIQFFKVEFLEHFSDPGDDTLETVRIASLPAFGTLALSGVPVTVNQVIPYASLDDLVFTPGGSSGSTSFGWNASDGHNYAASNAQVTLNITDENQYPSGWESSVATLEDQQYVFQASDFLFSDPDVGDTLQAIHITDLPDHGTLYFDYNSNQQIDSGEAVVTFYDGYVSLAQLNAGVFRYWPDANWHSTDYFRFWVSDGKLWSIGPGDVMWVTITSVPDPPTVTDFTKYGTEDFDISFTAINFSSYFTDPDGNTMAGIKIASLPDHGTLRYSGDPVTLNQEITTANIPNLIFRPDANWNGVSTCEWNGFDGTLYAIENAVLSLSISAVNDPPTTSNQSITFDEDGQWIFAPEDFPFSDPDKAAVLSAVQVKTLPAAGALYYDSNLDGLYESGEEVAINQVIAANVIPYLIYAPAQNGNGSPYASFTFKVNDGLAYSASSAQMTINISPVADPPTAADFTLNGSEDTDLTFTSADFSSHFSDPDGDSMTRVKIASLPDHGTLLLNSSPVSVNQEIDSASLPDLKFQPDPNWNGSTSFAWNGYDGASYAAENAVVSLEIAAVDEIYYFPFIGR